MGFIDFIDSEERLGLTIEQCWSLRILLKIKRIDLHRVNKNLIFLIKFCDKKNAFWVLFCLCAQ